MIGTVFRSEDVPAEDRFEVWRELVGRTRPSDAASVHASDFRAECHAMELGPVTVLELSSLPASYRRSPKLARHCDPETYHLTLLLEGELALEHVGRTGVFGTRELHVVDGSRPFHLHPTDDRPCQANKGVGVDVPKALLPVPARQLQELLGRGLPGQEGVGALLTEFLVGVGRQAAALQPADAPRLGAVLLDLVSAWLASLVNAEATLAPETRQRVTAEGVQAFIRRNLHDPDLTPSAIAAAHHISLSYLYRIFQQQSHEGTVAAWIRSRRLEGARRDLADPSLSDRPIHAVAARWCFPRASDFTRAFRAAYGLSPREYRSESVSRHLF